MLNAKKVIAAVAVVGTSFAVFSTGTAAVQADPVSNSYAIVGSDTLEDVVNAIVNGTAITGSTVRVDQNGAYLGSFDATGTGYVITKPGGVRFTRPNGSGEGFRALSASIGGASNTVAISKAELTTQSSTAASDVVTYTYTPSATGAIYAGAKVTITGFTTATYNKTNLNVASATAAAGVYKFTVAGGVDDALAVNNIETIAATAVTDANAFSLFTTSTFQNVNGTNTTTIPSSVKNINIFEQVDISRSSSTDPASSLRDASAVDALITRVPFGRDAIALAFGSTAARNLCDAGKNAATAAELAANANTCKPYLTGAELKTIFEATTVAGQTVAGVALQGVLPQTGSGTRKDFISFIGAKDDTTSVQKVGNLNSVSQEHDSSSLVANGVMAMSASRWIAMKNGASFDKSGTAVIGGAYTATTLGVSPVTGVAPALTPVKAYYDDGTWGRDVFLFAERARLTSGNAKYDANLFALLDSTLNKLSNTQVTGASKVGKVKLLYGFLAPSSTDLAYFAPSYTGTK